MAALSTAVFAASLCSASAVAGQTVSVQASLTPDAAGSSTNLATTLAIGSDTEALPPPVTEITAEAPEGLRVDTRGTAACAPLTLERIGPGGCPAASRAGFGGGVVLARLGPELISERFTIDLFLAPSEHGRLTLLAFLDALEPASIERVLVIHALHPHGPSSLGFTVQVPLIATIPGASDASLSSAFLSFGASDIAYYERVRGRRTLVHVAGLLAPRRCPHGRLRLTETVDFADGSSASASAPIPCPHG